MARHANYRLLYSEARARAGRAPWLLVTPASLSADGKRKQTAYSSEKEARAALRTAEQNYRAHGTAVAQLPHTAEQLAAVKLATDTVTPYGITLQNAAAFAATCCAEFGDLATALQLARWAALRATENTWPDITLAAAMQEHLQAIAHLSESSNRMRKNIFTRLYREHTLFCENTYLHALTTEKLRDLICRPKYTPQVQSGMKACLSAMLTWAAGKGYMSHENPLQRLNLPTVQEATITCLQPSELRALLRHAPNQGTQLYIAICALAGVRPTEATRLTWADVSPDEPILSVRSKKSKTGGARHIPVCSALQEWLAYCRPERVTPSTPLCPTTRRFMARAKRLAGLQEWQQDVLRHSFASYALKDGMSLQDLQLAMGHRDLSMLRARYLNMQGLTKALAAEWWSTTPDSVFGANEVHTV